MIKVKEIKEKQMQDLEKTFREVRDLVLFSTSGLNAIVENKIRLDLRKKNIRMKLVKNTFMQRICERLGMKVDGLWTGPTMVAWGSGSLADLSKELERTFKGNKAVQFKGAVADGQQVTFEQALKMPTKAEAIGRVVTLMLSPAARLISQIKGPAGAVASQIKTISEGKKDEAEAPAAQGA
jgi:large subunit ribosomal protein L10